MYSFDPHIAELYDQIENYMDDVGLIRTLMGDKKKFYILEPFCGTGRICIPLAQAGHRVVGIDQSRPMLDRARVKIKELSVEIPHRIDLIQADVMNSDWPGGFDLVILGGNCFYEFGTAEEQERCIDLASKAVLPGGYIYVDNNHMEGDLDPSWYKPGIRSSFPTGTCEDGTVIMSTSEPLWHDAPMRLIKELRRTKIVFPTGDLVHEEYVRQTHPVSTLEVQSWLGKYGFEIRGHYGDRSSNPYTPASTRSIFWGQKV
ncbi:MAG: class I SAM-dependent methyltransferase [Chloroflexi bacterium]|nr:MAG: class I SAM-dependent methyltransferase [Chloroflexota bacterium]MBL1195587.1 class I SAM-dependent methyltransferase [Chloroflexota bacterium]NOH12874.1 class I SAM-dependent methyltransferase [Chloroflexota bacterium]